MKAALALVFALAIPSFALPSFASAQVVPPPAAPPVQARIVLRDPEAPVTVHRVLVEGPRSRWTGQHQDLYEPVCNAPCEVALVPGAYRLALSDDGTDPVRVNRILDVRDALTIEVDYDNRSELRVAGWVIFGVSFLTAAGLALGILTVDTGARGYETGLYAWAGAAIGTVVLGGGVSIPFVGLQDHSEVRVLP